MPTFIDSAPKGPEAPREEPARRRARGLLALGLLLGLSALALFFFRGEEDHSFSRIRSAGVLRVGYAIEAPYAYLDGDQVRGESPDIAREVCRRLGIARIEWVQANFEALIPGLLDRRYDVIAAGLFTTPERKLLVAFSEPTFVVRPGLLVRKGNPLGIRSYNDLLDRGSIKVAAVAGSAEERWLKNHGFAGARLESVPDALTGRVAVASSLVDALCLSSLTLRIMAKADAAGVETVELPPYGDDEPPLGLGAFAFRKEDRTLLAAWDAVLQDYIGTREHRQLVEPLGFTAGETSFAEDAKQNSTP